MLKTAKQARRRRAVHHSRALGHLLRIVVSFSRPDDILAAYLRRPVHGFSFRAGIERLMRDSLAAIKNTDEPRHGEIVRRTEAVLKWLDGATNGSRNPFEVLGVGRLATPAAIHARYRALSKRVHPDRHGSVREDYWRARQEEINDAYRILSNPQLRARCLAELERRSHLLQRLWEIENSDA